MNKRQFVLILSFATIICYGYALGGLGAYIFGQGKLFVIAAGLVGGTLCAWLALKLWRQFLCEIDESEKAAGQEKKEVFHDK